MGSYACETTRTWSMQLKQFIAFKRKRPRVIDCNICIPLDRVLISFTDLKISEFLSLLIINSFVCFIKKRFIQVFKNATRFAWGCKFDSHRKAKELHWSQLGSVPLIPFNCYKPTQQRCHNAVPPSQYNGLCLHSLFSFSCISVVHISCIWLCSVPSWPQLGEQQNAAIGIITTCWDLLQAWCEYFIDKLWDFLVRVDARGGRQKYMLWKWFRVSSPWQTKMHGSW